LLRASIATVRPISTSALCRSDEEKGQIIDNTAKSRQLHASEVNMTKAGEELVKKAAVIKVKKSGKSKEQTEKENAAVKKNAADKAAAKKEVAKNIAVKKTASKKEAAKNAAGVKAAAKKEGTKKSAVKKAAAEKAPSAKKAANEEVAANKVGVLKSIKRKTATKKAQVKTLQEIDVIEKTAAKEVKKVVKKDVEERAIEPQEGIIYTARLVKFLGHLHSQNI